MNPDTRKFGVMYLFETTNVLDIEKFPPLSSLGYEPFNEKLNLEYLKETWKNTKKPIKTSLLDQSVITGLGNTIIGAVSLALLVPGFICAFFALVLKTHETKGINMDTVTGCEWD